MKRSGIRVAAATIAVGLLLAGVASAIAISTGAYNVAATTPHTPITHWLLHTTMQRSVSVRARNVATPPRLDSGTVKHGFAEYDAMCAECHGAPGVERGTLGKGMNPEPPDLAKAAGEWNDRELFWITKHGIKMAGMPAFGVTHSDAELWGIVAVLRRLQYMSAAEYKRSVADAGAHGGMHGIVADAGGETVTSKASAHAHTGTQTRTAQPRADTPRTDHSGMGHVGAVVASPRRASVQPSPHQEHERAPSDVAAKKPAGVAAPADIGSTQKLMTLAAELLQDPIVLERIRADSALRRRWENAGVRKQLGTPPR
jgi:mono/diheme cytochrome c family protein